eukprot:1152974-Pelagomonas_calceolata.AAC.2
MGLNWGWEQCPGREEGGDFCCLLPLGSLDRHSSTVHFCWHGCLLSRGPVPMPFLCKHWPSNL